MYIEIHMNESKILREGWFDRVSNALSNDESKASDDEKKISDAWINEKEIELGADLSDDIKQSIYSFVSKRYEKALQIYKNDAKPVRKAIFTLVRLLDKKFDPIINDLYS